MNFDSGKVLGRIRDSFPSFVSDGQDLLQAEFERFLQFLRDAAVPEPTRSVMEQQMRGKSLRNGPVYNFSIELPDGTPVTGWTRRFSVHFKSERALNDSTQAHIIRFLLALEAGEIFCDTQTRYFSVPSQTWHEDWALDPNSQF
ncbi:MAG TPA: hypothetical protein VD886_10130 [Herpetosiphonaceae bacterium]|nr:hypothetical protein [Herpetosiphonaceae bacterium]